MSRRHLPHDVPRDVTPNPEGEVFFITIACVPRGVDQQANPKVWNVITQSLAHREALGDIRVLLVLAMPDHLHGLFSFPGTKPMHQVISSFKEWVAKCTEVQWQRDFFDHRLRDWESGREKADYIRNNPVRAGLVERSEDWPYQWQRQDTTADPSSRA